MFNQRVGANSRLIFTSLSGSDQLNYVDGRKTYQGMYEQAKAHWAMQRKHKPWLSEACVVELHHGRLTGSPSHTFTVIAH